MKTCTKCNTPKILDEFVKDKRRVDGRGSWCLVCNREYLNKFNASPEGQAARKSYYEANRQSITASNRVRWAKRKKDYKAAIDAWRATHRVELLSDYRRRGEEYRSFLDTTKLGKACADCGETYLPYCMEYDHVRGVKRWALGKMANHRRDAVLAEIAKCDLVCCACHRVRTQVRKGSSTIRKVIEFREWLSTFKSKPCMDCGRTRPLVAMDFDHVRGEKVNQITNMWSWGRDRVLAEIAKCDLVCCICHRIRTQFRIDQRAA